MKKMVWAIVGAVVIAGVILIGRERTQGSQEIESVESTASHPAPAGYPGADESRRASGGSAQGLQDAGGTEGQTGKSAPQELSDPVKALLGLDDQKHNYPSLLSAINDLDDEISADDVAALMEMLNFPNDRFPEKMRSIEINAVKNDVLDKLLRQKQLPEGLGLHMVEMAGNTDNDPVWRDYCIQFFPMVWERIDAEYRITNIEQGTLKESNKSMDELSAVHDAMFTALDERDETLAGTSLIGLELLSRTHAEFDRELIVNKATEIASDEMASPASRMTALRLAAGISNSKQGISNVEVVQAARALAQTGETVLLRSAAIVTLGEVGTSDDRELLESYTLSENKQIVDAAKLALEKMDQDPSVGLEVASKPTSEPQVTEKLPPVLQLTLRN